MKRSLLTMALVYLATSIALAAWLLPTGREQPPSPFAAPRATPAWPLDGADREAARTRALRQARVWMAAASPSRDLGTNPADPAGTLSGPIVRCRYLDGEVVKVKYGHTGEIPAEIAASRLLTALGFGADRMFLVRRVRCFGCVRTPFYTNWVLDKVGARELVVRSVPEDSYTDFEWAAVERHFDGTPIEAFAHEGWAWFELDPADLALGAGRAERDALRLMAMFLAHWDNKAANQRLVCLSPLPAAASPCPRPFAFINDLGATFGPNKVDIEHWKAAPIWADRARCTVSMRQFPYSGSTFSDTTISEAGRQLIARQLAALTEPQVMALFAGARFRESGGTDERAWTAVFFARVRQIVDGPACPL